MLQDCRPCEDWAASTSTTSTAASALRRRQHHHRRRQHHLRCRRALRMALASSWGAAALDWRCSRSARASRSPTGAQCRYFKCNASVRVRTETRTATPTSTALTGSNHQVALGCLRWLFAAPAAPLPSLLPPPPSPPESPPAPPAAPPPTLYWCSGPGVGHQGWRHFVRSGISRKILCLHMFLFHATTCKIEDSLSVTVAVEWSPLNCTGLDPWFVASGVDNDFEVSLLAGSLAHSNLNDDRTWIDPPESLGFEKGDQPIGWFRKYNASSPDGWQQIGGLARSPSVKSKESGLIHTWQGAPTDFPTQGMILSWQWPAGTGLGTFTANMRVEHPSDRRRATEH